MHEEPEAKPLTAENIAKMSDDEFDRSIFEYVLSRYPEPEDDDTDYGPELRSMLENLPLEVRTYFMAVSFELECSGGGLDSFFYNGSAQTYDLTIDALRRVGATFQANALNTTMQLIEKECNLRPALRRYWIKKDFMGMFTDEDNGDWSESFQTEFNQIDEDIVQRDGEVRELCVAYAKSNKKAFALE